MHLKMVVFERQLFSISYFCILDFVDFDLISLVVLVCMKNKYTFEELINSIKHVYILFCIISWAY